MFQSSPSTQQRQSALLQAITSKLLPASEVLPSAELTDWCVKHKELLVSVLQRPTSNCLWTTGVRMPAGQTLPRHHVQVASGGLPSGHLAAYPVGIWGPTLWAPGLFPQEKGGLNVKLLVHLHLVHGTISPLPRKSQ
jgi:hypothetical protein